MTGVKQAVGRQRLETYSEVEGMNILFSRTKRIRVEEISDSEKDKDDRAQRKRRPEGIGVALLGEEIHCPKFHLWLM